MATTTPIAYGKGAIYNSSGQMTEATSISVAVTSNLNVVSTLAKNFAGVSPGPITATISVSSAIPADGWEANPNDFLQKTIASDLTVSVGGLTMTVTGFFQSYTVSTAVDGSATISFEFIGGGESGFEGGILG